ncbi:MAG TPA: GTPase HflX [Candidatus Dormibacteraeota bacterium]|nr:GTPase HflX [Candidatus Dormibacteraeota bacterium]
MITIKTPRERAYLVGVLLPGASDEKVREQMQELADLTRTAGADVVGSDVQKRSEVEPALFIGMGKVNGLRDLILEGGFDLLVCNEDLSPRQQRNLERELKVRVFDRTEVILEIFAQHARTHEGRLQVEAARLHHQLPRLIGSYSYDRQVGGQRGGLGSRGGPGEQQIETEKRRIRKRIRDLESEIEQVRTQRAQQRIGRRRAELETAAIVGYTNAGKSTLLNALTGAQVRAEHRLFATLDPTTRRLDLPAGRGLLLTDTVGFIQKLPTDLVAAFRATLEEVTEADLVIQVLDASSPAVEEQASTVDKELTALGAGDKPRVVALNKVDLLGPASRRRVIAALSARYPGLVPISATQGLGLDELMDAIDAATRADMVGVELLVPYGSERVLASLRKIGGIERTEYLDAGTRAWGWAPRHAAARFEPYSVAAANGRGGSRRGRRRPG